MRIRNGKEVTREWLNYMELEENKSEQEIADELGISRQGLYKLRKRMGWDQFRRSDKGKDRGGMSGDELKRYRSKYMRDRYWSGKSSKYKVVRVGKRLVAEHRLKMEDKLGRVLRPGEIIHHVDGNTLNNDINNLYLCKDQAEHLRLHQLDRIQEAVERLDGF